MKRNCYTATCAKYPDCANAATCCAIEFDEEIPDVEEGECTAENGYPYFEPKTKIPVYKVPK